MRELDSQLRLAKLSCSYSSLLSTPTSPNLSVSLQQLKYQARALYKELHYLAREYPDPNYPIHAKLHACFLAHSGAEREKVEAGIRKAEFIKKELEAMYYLRKYRMMKSRYYPS